MKSALWLMIVATMQRERLLLKKGRAHFQWLRIAETTDTQLLLNAPEPPDISSFPGCKHGPSDVVCMRFAGAGLAQTASTYLGPLASLDAFACVQWTDNARLAVIASVRWRMQHSPRTGAGQDVRRHDDDRLIMSASRAGPFVRQAAHFLLKRCRTSFMHAGYRGQPR